MQAIRERIVEPYAHEQRMHAVRGRETFSLRYGHVDPLNIRWQFLQTIPGKRESSFVDVINIIANLNERLQAKPLE